MIKIITFLFTSFVFLAPEISYAQLNSTLKQICNDLKIEKDSSFSNYFYRSRGYQIQIYEDSLTVELSEIDSVKFSQSLRVSNKSYKLNLKNIGEINFVNNKWTTPYIEIIALRFYPLFSQTIDKEEAVATEYLKIPVIRIVDTIYLKKIVSILNSYVEVEKNYIEPTCNFELLKLTGENNKEISAIESLSLVETVKLNGNKNLNEEIYFLFKEYLLQQNIQKFYGDIVINNSDSLEYIESYQNTMYNHNNSLALKSKPISIEILAKKAHFFITDEHMTYFTEKLKKQNWQAGICNDTKVNSYFNFYIENTNYKKPGDNK